MKVIGLDPIKCNHHRLFEAKKWLSQQLVLKQLDISPQTTCAYKRWAQTILIITPVHVAEGESDWT